ncbi:MAG: CHAP domain-containing protein [Ruminococcaceae bacterium]|nr:CHAP domain-containing protein [Oscillospiraceae bacterium]
MKKVIKAISHTTVILMTLLLCVIILNADFENTHQNTGDALEDIIAVAETQLGYLEGTLEGNVAIGNDVTKYGDWYGLNNNPWCAMFVSWCADQAGIPTTVIPKHASCDVGMQWFIKNESFTYGSFYGGSDTPKRGDIIYFGYRSSAGAFDSNHVGIVYKVSENSVYVYEGNSSNKVQSVTYKLGTSYILGFGSPNYGNDPVQNGYEPGKYIVNTAWLNFRSKPSAGSERYELLPQNTLLDITEVTEDGWGKAVYNSNTGWVSLEYCLRVYEVRYDANGGETAPLPQYKNSAQSLILTDAVPENGGKLFLGWSVEKNGEVEYKPGDEYKNNKDVVLYAVWDKTEFFTVAYNANGGSDAPEAQRKEKGKPVLISDVIPVRDGYEFTGWADSPVTEVKYRAGDEYTEDKSITLYAVWKKKEFLPGLELVCGEGGTVTKRPNDTKVEITVKADAGYALSYLAINGKAMALLGDISEYSMILDVQGLEKIEARFTYNEKLWINPFIDVSDNAWYYDAARYCYTNGLMTGVAADRYAPERNLTRAQFVTIIGRMYERFAGVISCSSGIPFEDVEEDAYYSLYLCWAYNNGIVSGTSATSFNPSKLLTREQLCVILCNYESFINGKEIKADEIALAGYKDNKEVSSWALNAVSWAVNEGYLNGSSNKLLPKGSATRAQASNIIMKYCMKKEG